MRYYIKNNENYGSKILFKNRVVGTYSHVWETGVRYTKNGSIKIEVSRNPDLTSPFFVYENELYYGHEMYDNDGVLRNVPTDEIKKGDIVCYLDAKTGKNVKGREITVKEPLYGVWDGEKVEFDDKDKTIVRNIRWLKKLPFNQLRKSTIEELKGNPFQFSLPLLIANSEKRFVEYKKLLADLYKDKKLYSEDDFEWLRVHLKELKNSEEKFWKSLVAEWTEIKQTHGI